MISPKIRITFLDSKLRVQSDRLVSQDNELNVGPKEKHTGPCRFEITLRDSKDVELFKEYLDKLSSDLPIVDKPVKVIKTTKVNEKIPVETVISKIKESTKDQSELLNFLNNWGFAMIPFDHFLELNLRHGWGIAPDISKNSPDLIQTRPWDPKGYAQGGFQVMIRRVKQAKNPVHDKYDPSVIVLVKLLGDHKDFYYIYKTGTVKPEKITLQWPSNYKINFKTKRMLWKFPVSMTYDERKKWRGENQKVQRDPEYTPPKFYIRYAPYVMDLTKNNVSESDWLNKLEHKYLPKKP